MAFAAHPPLRLLALIAVYFLAFLPAVVAQKFEVWTGFPLDGRAPFAPVVQGEDGSFYGTTAQGGPGDGFGTVFKADANGYVTTLVKFTGTSGSAPGEAPVAGLTLGSDGSFYGTTNRGGADNLGTVFKVTAAGVLTPLAQFTGTSGTTRGANPWAELAWGTDGALYGTTERGGAADEGTIFKVTADGVMTTLHEFTAGRPKGGLLPGSDGDLYGTTELGGANGLGSVFSVRTDGTLSTVISFTGTSGAAPGARPWGRLVEAGGTFYGTTYAGGAGDLGTVFSLAPGSVFNSLVSFTGGSGAARGTGPLAGLAFGNDGYLYGTTWLGGATDNGTVFRLTPTGVFTSLVSLSGNGGAAPGRMPYGELLLGRDGFFYGTTSTGGGQAVGTVFKMSLAGALTTFVKFTSSSANGLGRLPTTPPVQAPDGNFYGATEFGGVNDQGTLYKVTAEGVVTLLTNLTGIGGPAPGDAPVSHLVVGTDGALYGTTVGGGTAGLGTVFKITPSGVFKTVLSFSGAGGTAPGSYPRGALTPGPGGNFFGATSDTIYKMTPTGELTTLVTFSQTNGSSPDGPLVFAPDGNFYGTTYQGGANDMGTIFRMTPAGTLTTLVHFSGTSGSAPGAYPSGGLLLGPDESVYGTTMRGGVEDSGTVFRVTTSGAFISLHGFLGASANANGSSPNGGLARGPDGKLYGTTMHGGINNRGTLFQITSAGALRTLVILTGDTGTDPLGGMLPDGSGDLYGTMPRDLVFGAGTIYRLSFKPIAVTSPATDLSAREATLHGLITTNGLATTVTFEYGPDATYGETSAAVSLGGANEPVAVNAALAKLLPHTTYHFRVKAVNAVGIAHGLDRTFETANTPPLAIADSSHPEGTGPFTFALLSNDSDTDGDVLSITAVTNGAQGTVSTNGTSASYTPGPGYQGSDSFTYTVADGFGGTATASVTLLNNLPVLGDDSFHPPPGTAPFILNVRANDSDADRDTLVITSAANGEHGSVNTDGTDISYAPSPTYAGTDTFTYSASDAHGGTATATVMLHNELPLAQNESASFSGESVTVNVLGNDSDPDGDALVIVATSNGNYGTVTSEGATVTYTPSVSFSGTDAFTYTITDQRGAAAATATVTVQSGMPFPAVLMATGAPVPGEPPGTLFTRFGVPSILRVGEADAVAFKAQFAGSAIGSGVFGPVAGGALGILARAGDSAPGLVGVTFQSFSDPLLGATADDETGRVSFLAKLAGPAAAGSSALFTNATPNASFVLVARTGDAVPGVPQTRWRKVRSVAMNASGDLFFVADMEGGANTTALWRWRHESGLSKVVAKAESIEVGGSAKVVRTFTALALAKGSPGQARDYDQRGVGFRAIFTDGTQAVIGTGREVHAASGDEVASASPGARWRRFGLPTMRGAMLTVGGTLEKGAGGVSAADDSVIFSQDTVLAREGSPAPGTAGNFTSFSDPLAHASSGAVVFAARLSGVPASEAAGLWRWDTQTLELVARTDGTAAGVPGGRWKSFTGVLLPEWSRGPVFSAKLAASPGEGSVKSRRSAGVWAIDSTGALRLLARTGLPLSVGSAAKTIQTLTFLSTVAKSPAQGRFSNEHDRIIGRVTFTDLSEAIATIFVP